MLVNQGSFGVKSNTEGLGHHKDNKKNGRKVLNNHEIPLGTRVVISTLSWIFLME
jgi:hypothetical protein